MLPEAASSSERDQISRELGALDPESSQDQEVAAQVPLYRAVPPEVPAESPRSRSESLGPLKAPS